jgi:3-oxoadipate enol-lactonase
MNSVDKNDKYDKYDKYEGYVAVEGARLFYRLDGSAGAPVLVLVNSLGLSLDMWDPQVPRLATRFRLLRYDCRGHGRSAVPIGPYSLDQLGRDLLGLFDALEIETAAICGLSLGGMIALWLAANHPARLTRVVLANTGARIGTDTTWKERIEAIQQGGLAAVRDTVVGRFLSAAYRQRHPEVNQWVANMLMATPPAGYIAACEALAAADLHDALPRLRLPCLVIGGTADQATPPAQSEELQSAIPGSELALLPGAPHLSNVEQADTFTALLAAFLPSTR